MPLCDGDLSESRVLIYSIIHLYTCICICIYVYVYMYMYILYTYTYICNIIHRHWVICFPLVFWRCWLGDRNCIRPVKIWLLIWWWWWFDWSIATVATATSIILGSYKLQSGDILVLAYSDCLVIGCQTSVVCVSLSHSNLLLTLWLSSVFIVFN